MSTVTIVGLIGVFVVIPALVIWGVTKDKRKDQTKQSLYTQSNASTFANNNTSKMSLSESMNDIHSVLKVENQLFTATDSSIEHPDGPTKTVSDSTNSAVRSEPPARSESSGSPEVRSIPADYPRITVDGSKPLARVLDQIEVHVSPEANSKVTFRLQVGVVVELHKLWKKNGGWIEMRAPSDLMGYFSSETAVTLLQRGKLKAKEVEIFNQPSTDSMLIKQLTKGTLFWILTGETSGDSQWMEVQLDSGENGYMPASTKVAKQAQITYPAVQSASYDVLVGLLWCIGGIVVTAATYSAAEEAGGTYLICWGAVVFGGFQFLRGLFRAAVAEQATNHDNNTFAGDIGRSANAAMDAINDG